MRVILDTNSFLWFISGNEKLSNAAKIFISDFNNELILSTASLWEIAIKISIGKLELSQPYDKFIPQQLEENDIAILPITLKHLTKLIDLSFKHRDPFDRLIIAQALSEDLPVISSDIMFSEYPIKLIW
jgi:PIN domain nuclease of toxin-antitoxin system